MKSVIILGLIVAIFNVVVASDYEKAIIETNEAFPGLIVGSPEVASVEFDNGATVDLGKPVKTADTVNQPTVNWNARNDSYYTIMIVDPDAPSREDPYMRDSLTWLVVNIPGKNIDAGEVLSAYVSAGPPRNMGVNRYFYLIFCQHEKQVFDEKRVGNDSADGRINFPMRSFIDKYELGSPVALNFMSCTWDEQTNKLYKQVHCCEELL